jgi:ankyrin repeat protein
MSVREFHGIQAPNRNDAFVVAAGRGMIPEMKAILADGADVDGILSKFGGALHGGSALHTAARCGKVRSVDFLVTAGTNLNLLNHIDLTPLMCASNRGKVEGSAVALRLIEAGAHVRHVRKSDEMTALKFAVGSCSPNVLQALIDHGAQVDGPRGTKLTALMLAARENHVASLRVLVKNGARLSLKCKLPWAEGRTAEGLAELEKRKKALAYLRGLRSR